MLFVIDEIAHTEFAFKAYVDTIKKSCKGYELHVQISDVLLLLF